MINKHDSGRSVQGSKSARARREAARMAAATEAALMILAALAGG